MTTSSLKKLYLDFFVKKGHQIIPSASLVPENDPTALFISAGMHPLVPYLLGEPHPLGKKLCSVQRCLRTGDIDFVGDGFHHTFFEMLGNWSLGDYWKKEAIGYSWEFLTKILQIPAEKISVSCFAGDQDAPRDEETAQIWQNLGIPREKIHFLGKKENWWGPIGQTGPCGPDTEMFYDTGKPVCGPDCNVACQCGKYLEIWNDVFMQYEKTAAGRYRWLKQRNVDTGMGVERVTAVLSGFEGDDYRTDAFWPIVEKIQSVSGQKYAGKNQVLMRIIADHLRAAVFLINDGVRPGNIEQGYVVRRLLRRAAVKMRLLTGKLASAGELKLITDTIKAKKELAAVIGEEMVKFEKTLDRGLRQVKKSKNFDGKTAFDLYQSYGFPFEITQELAQECGQKISQQAFAKELTQHQQISRQGATKKFAGGLADHSAVVTKYHTATHLLQQALRDVLGDQVHQIGSNITAERLRFDFTHPQALTSEEIEKVEKIVNQKIKAGLPVTMTTMSLAEAKKQGGLAFFEGRYADKVKMYSIGDYSKEVCGGPHVTSTREIGSIKVTRQKAVGAGRRRLYATLAHGS